jgi:hypothetical protein
MENDDIRILQDKIEAALQIAAIKLIESKRKNKQKMVVSRNGKIVVIDP